MADSDFIVKLKAQLDDSSLQKQIDNAGKDKTLVLKKISIDTKGLGAKIQQALDGYKFTLNLTNVKVDNLSKTITGSMRSTGEKAGEDFTKALVGRINTQLSNGGFESSIAKLEAQYQKLFAGGQHDNKLHAQLVLAKNDINELQNLQKQMAASNDPDEMVASYQKFVSVLDRAKNGLATAGAQSRTFVSSLQLANLDNKIAVWMDKNSKATRDFGGQLEALRARLAQLSSEGGATTGQFRSIENEFKAITSAATAAGQTGRSFSTIFQEGFKRLTNYVSASTIIYQSINGLRKMYQAVYSIDTEMTELKKVTDETASSYENFLKRSAGSAKEIGTTISDLVSSTADFARLGYSLGDAEELAKVANVYNVVGDELDGIDEATKSLISTMTAFKGEMGETATQGEFAMSIIDKFNEVGNNFAISSGGIGDALERSASSLAAANNSLDQSIALITAANTVVQNPEVVGRHYADIKNNYIG